MQGTGKKELSKKILCSILAAGVLSVGGVQCVWAGEYGLDRDNPVEGNNKRYAAITGSVSSIEDDDMNINIIGQSGDDRIYGIVLASGESLTIDGEKMVVGGSAVDDTEIRFIRSIAGESLIINNDIVSAEDGIKTESGFLRFADSWTGANIVFNGDTDVNLISESGTISGIGAREKGNITFNGDSKFNFHSDTGRIVGIENWNNQGGKITFNGNLDLTMSNSSSSIQKDHQALLAYQSTTEFNGNTNIKVFNNSVMPNTRVVNIECDPGNAYDTIVNFNGEETTLSVESVDNARIIYVSGVPGYLNFNGETITLSGKAESHIDAIRVQYGANIKSVAGSTVNIDVKSANKYANGINLGEYAGYNGNAVDLKGNLNVTASGKIYAMGINVLTEDNVKNPEEVGVYVGGDTVIDTSSSDGDALGAYADGQFANVELAGNVDIKTNGNVNSFALLAQNGGTITVGSEGKTVSLVGDVVADGENSVINIAGDAVFNEKDTEFTSTNNGIINLAGGNLSGVLNISEGSTVNLNGATFATNDIASDITGGGKLVLKDSGVLSTTSDQIFTSESGKVTATDEVDGINNTDKVIFESGTVSLTDAEYNLEFLHSAVAEIGSYKYDNNNTSKTGIVMTGDLVGGIEDNKISVDDAASVGDDIALDKVTVEADNNLLVGAVVDDNTEVESITIHDSVTNGFNAGSLNLAEGSTGMVITNDKNVTLGGSAGGNIITVTGNESAAVNVVVGTNDLVNGATSTTGSFTIGNALATSETKYTLNGSVTVNDGSNLTTNGQTTITEGVTLNGGNLDAASGALNANVTVEANTTNTITGTVNAGKLTAGSGTDTLDDSANKTVINIGNNDKAANVVVTEADLNGATVFLDPAWKGNDVISDASNMAVANVENGIDGHYVVGQNSVLSFGVDNTAKAQEVFAKTGLTWGEDDITAALYIAKSVDLTNGSVVVNGSLTDAPATSASNGTFTAEKGSVTMIDGSKFNDTAVAITGVTTATIDDGAKLYIDNAKKNETYKVISGTGVATEADDRWSTDNIDFDNTLLVVDTENTKVENNTFVVGAKYQKVDDAYGKGAVVIADVVDKTLTDKNEGDAAFDFFNAAASDKNNATKEAQVAAFNSAANMGEMGGVNHAAYSVSNAMTDAVADHLSIATHGDQDKDIWAHYVHNKENIEGISLGGINADYDLQYNGIVVGSDLYKNGKATAGIALSYVEGDVNSYNIAANTKNEAEYYGASVYGRIDNGNSAVLGDITYMHGSSDITQHNSGHKLTADADTDVFSIGVKAEQKVEAGIGQFVPYAGLRYMHIGTGNYTNSIGMNYDVDEQNLWLLPVGVTYSCEAQKGDWTIRPVVEAGYVWAMGDRDTNQTVSLNGAADGFGFDTADSGSFISRFAVEAEKANVIYSLGYEYQKGDTVKANKWMGNMTWSF